MAEPFGANSTATTMRGGTVGWREIRTVRGSLLGFDSSNRNAPNTACAQSDTGGGWRYDCAGNAIRDASNATYGFDAEGTTTAYCPNTSVPGQCAQAAGDRAGGLHV